MESSNTIPPPPPGFAPVAAPPNIPPPPPGFSQVPAGDTQQGDSTPPQPPSSFIGDVGEGFKTALNQTGDTAMSILGHTGLNRLPGWQQSQQETTQRAHAPIDTKGKIAGAVIENLIEYMAGDEALKGASTLAKIKELAPVAEAFRKNPTLTRIFGNAVRAQALGTAQAAGHGASGGEAVASGALNAVGGSVLEGVGEGWRAGRAALNDLRPTTETIAETTVPMKSAKAGGGMVAPAIKNDVVDPATTKVDQALETLGRRAVRRSATRSNASRAQIREPLPPSRQLPAPEGRPAGMSIRTGETAPTGEGQIAFDPRKKQIGTKAVEGKGRPAEAPTPLTTDGFAGTPEEREAYMEKHVGTGNTKRPRPLFEEFETEVPADNLPEGYRMITQKSGPKSDTYNVRIIDENDIQRGLLEFDRGASGKHDRVRHLILHPDLQDQGLAQEMMRQSGVVDPTIKPGSPISAEGAAAINRFNRRYPSSTGPAEPTAPARRGSHREPQYQYLTERKPGQAEPVTDTPMGGGGTLILTNDGQALSSTRARTLRHQIEQVLNDPAQVDEMTTRQHQQLIDQHSDLSEQLRRYEDYDASQPHFDPHPVEEMVQNTSSLGDSGKNLKAANSRFWTKANELSNGRFSELRDQEKALQNALRSEGRTGDRAVLSENLARNQAEQEALFDEHRTSFTPEEWKAHRDGYQDGMVMDNFDSILQSHFNGITRADVADSGGKLQRIFKPSENMNKQVENFLDKGTNREVVERNIGRDGVLDIKRLGQLFNSAERMDATMKLRDYITSSIKAHYRGKPGAATAAGGGLGFLLGHPVAGAIGVSVPLTVGTAAGIKRWVTDQLISNPQFAKRFIYAVDNNLGPRNSGLLLAHGLMSSAGTNASTPEPNKTRIEDENVVPANAERGIKPVTLPVLKEEKK